RVVWRNLSTRPLAGAEHWLKADGTKTFQTALIISLRRAVPSEIAHPAEPRRDRSRRMLNFDDRDRAIGRGPKIDHLPPVSEGLLLRDVEVAAEVESGGDGLEGVEEAPLAPVPSGRGEVGEADWAAVGHQDIDRPPARGEPRVIRNVLVGDVIRLPVRLGP